jgi:hypothetical protein
MSSLNPRQNNRGGNGVENGSSIPNRLSLQYSSSDLLQSLANSNGTSLLTGSSGALPLFPVLVHRNGNSNGTSQLTAGSSGAVPLHVVQSLGNSNGASRLTGSNGALPLPVGGFLPAFASSQIPSSISLPYHLASTPITNQTFHNALSFSVMPGAASLSAELQLPTIQAAVAEPVSTLSSQYCRILYLDQDDDSVSPYQCLVRKQIEVFQATESYLRDKKQGRNKPVVLYQIGIRCRHCGRLPGNQRAKGAVFFPSQLDGLYQTAQNMANKHLLQDCREIPTSIREELFRVRLKEKGAKTRKSAYGGGRNYWADGVRVLGVVQSPDRRLRLASPAS